MHSIFLQAKVPVLKDDPGKWQGSFSLQLGWQEMHGSNFSPLAGTCLNWRLELPVLCIEICNIERSSLVIDRPYLHFVTGGLHLQFFYSVTASVLMWYGIAVASYLCP